MLFDSLARGQTAEIRYEFRLFRETRGILSLLGDRMLLEEMVVYRAWYDEFDAGYILETSAGEVPCSSFEELQSRLAGAEVVFCTAPSADEGRLYIRVRATVIPRKLSPPFTLLEPFYPENHITDGWKERTIIGRMGDS